MNSTGWGIVLGYFDGVHIGHRRLIEELCRQSSKMGLKTMVYTFDRHPQNVIRPDLYIPLIYSPEEKYKILCGLGVDRVEMTAFHRGISQMTPRQFFEDILVKGYNMKYGVVGFNYRFGRGGRGNVRLLNEFAAEKGIRIDVLKPVKLEGHLVSSSYIRRLLREGDIKRANGCLGRNYTVSGRVIKGKGRGNGMGIPTANIRLPEGILYPAMGVYATNTYTGGKRYKSITNVGVNPTFNNDRTSIETYICGLKKDLYDSYIEVEFFERIREEKKFACKEELIKQIELDIKNLEDYF
ncbi:MAG: bifunctional riboflavin kinase/FAD synthetase [Bacillota bacterium]|nr:bifunctional riboflavin kinase/FAD synthetase [Bacillota bacterium]MDD3297288.1 bifunctional riboflavin kinase/FAD synthetase [Bacillota bacterium]MDD3850789.1 bifunctional riboflavin kinase/FAD synthetase [Bacillota bacterium]MDD4706804.1 bifunctional riboflavin kinase/FAD synthetase [Bacillota bacterium]